MQSTLAKIFRILRLKQIFFFTLIIFSLFLIIDYIFPFTPQVSYSQTIYDRDGKMLHAFLSQDQQWRIKCESKDISPIIRKALLTKEDKWFYYHPGINIYSIFRAIGLNIYYGKRTSGASTITMQLARMLNPKSRTYGNKLIEIFHALQLEWHFNKDEIFELYLNKVPYGGNIEGVRAAALLYFDRTPEHLSIAQAALLSVIPNKPVSMRPGKNDSLLLVYRNKWLTKLSEQNIFSPKEIKHALEEPIGARRKAPPRVLPHMSQWLRKSLGKDISIKTTIRSSFQSISELLLQNYMNRLRSMNIYNASILIVDNQSHQILTYIGSPDFSDSKHNGQVDAVQALRSPGSTLKPLIYSCCFDKGLLTPKSILQDVPENFDGYEPENFDSKFNGSITVEEALCQSLNIPAVKALQMIGKNTLIDKLGTAGCEYIYHRKNKLGLSLALGGCEMNLYQLAALYSIYANQGKYAPLSYLMTDTASSKYTIVSAEAAFMIADILSRKNRPELPEYEKSNPHLPKIAWKTGTSYGRRDAWSIGFNKKYTVAVWVGNCTGKGISGLSGAEIATPLLFDVFNNIDYNGDGSWIKPPKSLGFRLVCSITGKIPAEKCEHQIADFYIPGISSMDICNHLIEVKISSDEKYSYCASCCPADGYKTKWFENIEPSLAAYFDREKIRYMHQPPHNPECTRVFEGKPPKIVMPVANQEYMIEKKTGQLLALQANCEAEVRNIYWYVNDKFIRQAPVSEKVFFEPTPGQIKISCTDDKGRTSNISITVKNF